MNNYDKQQAVVRIVAAVVANPILVTGKQWSDLEISDVVARAIRIVDAIDEALNAKT